MPGFLFNFELDLIDITDSNNLTNNQTNKETNRMT